MANLFNSISIKSRLILMLILVTLTSSFVIGLLGWRNGRDALNSTISNQLTSIRSTQAYQIQSYFSQVQSQARTLAEDRMIVNAMKQFSQGYSNGIHRSLTNEQDAVLEAFYDEEILPRISSKSNSTPLSVLYQPKRSVARYFQYHYMADSAFPVGSKDELVRSKDETSIYSRFHEFYHPILRNLLYEFNHYDLFLIDIKSLSIVYSVAKEVDFGTSLIDGPFRESGLGALVHKIRAQPERGGVTLIDFRSYAPSYGAPASFLGAPIFDRNKVIGIVAIQLSADEINTVMTSDGSWEKNGLGLTGESYLVGADRLMRSDSRLFTEDAAAFREAQVAHGLSESTVDNVETFKTTILMQPATSSSVKHAFEERSGTHLTTNYLGHSVLSSYAPLELPSLSWAILTEVSEAEAFEPIARLQRNILMWGVVLVLLVAFLAVLLSKYFVRPIEKLTQGVKALGANDDAGKIANIDINSADEFGDLAHEFNAMAQIIRTQSEEINRANEENDAMLHSMLPTHVAKRFIADENVADNPQQVSVAYLYFSGLSDLSNRIGVARASSVLNDLFDLLDNTADRFEVQCVKTVGEVYMAACGISGTRLDHAKRVMDFAIAAQHALQRFNSQFDYQLSLQVGINSGAVFAAVIGNKRFSFEMWGETVDIARQIRSRIPNGSIAIGGSVYERVNEQFEFDPPQSVEINGNDIQVYRLETNNIRSNTMASAQSQR